jgi:glycosyltransferase involved in cell wall biosynthesis
LTQSLQQIEIIVVDDGSTDNTRSVVELYTTVYYIYQTNAGLSAARNTGIMKSKGQFLAFLDADDWFLQDSLSVNLSYLRENPELAFISGSYTLFNELTSEFFEKSKSIPDNHYCHLLKGNYIGMHATVLYRRWVFDHVHYDTALRACEDYDIYLKVARKFPIAHHTQIIAVYRIHTDNMSSGFVLMLYSALLALQRQAGNLVNEREKQCFKMGLIFWKKYYTEKIYEPLHLKLFYLNIKPDKKELLALKIHNKVLYKKIWGLHQNILKEEKIRAIKACIKKLIPAFLWQRLRKVLYNKPVLNSEK